MKILLCLLVLISSCKAPDVDDLNPLEPYYNPAFSDDTTYARDDYMELVNNYRNDIGLDSFLYSDEIQREAEAHAKKMATGEVAFGHLGSGERCQILITELGPANLCGEIVAKGQDSASEVFASWMSSSSHRSKISSTRYTHTGLGMAKSSKGVIYWAQIFLEVL